MAMITVVEYAQRIGKDHRIVRQKIKRGKLEAVKCGGTWLIDENEPYEDHRTKKFYQVEKAEKRKVEKNEDI